MGGVTARSWPRIFLLAGESSGDVLGARLMERLNLAGPIVYSGVGGERMRAAGLAPLFDADELAVMGFIDVALRLPALLLRVRQVVRAILAQKPDAVVLIDAQVFSALVAKGLKRAGFGQPIILYVAPSVWAWKPERAPKLKGVFDEILAILPFEPRVMAQLGGPPTSYVGHPVGDNPLFAPLTRREGGRWLAMLPGSRGGEIRRHMPLLKEVAQTLAATSALDGIVMPSLGRFAASLEAQTRDWGMPVEIVVDPSDKRQALEKCTVAVSCAGTATLELAHMDVPHLGFYAPDWLQMQAYRKAGRPRIALPNIVLGENIVPEMQPGPDYAGRIAEAAQELMSDASGRALQSKAFERMRAVLRDGMTPDKKEDAAGRILEHMGRKL